MNTQRILLTIVGAVVSLILVVILVRYSKKTVAKTMSKRHILHMLKMQSMDGKELTNAAKESKSDVISYKMMPLLLVKLEEEGLIQRTGNNRCVITPKGLESMKSLDSMSEEFQKLAKIIQKTSLVSKFIVSEIIDRITEISSMNDVTPAPKEEQIAVNEKTSTQHPPM